VRKKFFKVAYCVIHNCAVLANDQINVTDQDIRILNM